MHQRPSAVVGLGAEATRLQTAELTVSKCTHGERKERQMEKDGAQEIYEQSENSHPRQMYYEAFVSG